MRAKALKARSRYCFRLSWAACKPFELGNGALLGYVLPDALSETSICDDGSPPPDGQGVAAIAVGSSFSVALKEDGTVFTWGTSYFGELGDGTKDGTTRRVPARLDGLNNVVDVVAVPLRNASVGRHVLALTALGSVYAWGVQRRYLPG